MHDDNHVIFPLLDFFIENMALLSKNKLCGKLIRDTLKYKDVFAAFIISSCNQCNLRLNYVDNHLIYPCYISNIALSKIFKFEQLRQDLSKFIILLPSYSFC